ncbi:MAG: hypothetical protein AABN33_05670 [Acidobacteriota bacterium]
MRVITRMTAVTAASLTVVLLMGQTLAGNSRVLARHQGSVARNTRNDITPRGLFISKAADAMRVKVLDAKTGAAVAPNTEFNKDDSLKVVIESNFESYAYIINVEIGKNSTKRFLLYPNARAVNNRIRPNEPLELLVAFDDRAATEVLQVIVSHDRIAYLNSALNGRCSESENPCQLESRVAALVASIVGDKKPSTQTESAGIFPRLQVQKQYRSGLRSRDIILSPGKEKDNDANETYVAIPIKAGGNGHLKAKEVFVFELRLKHV